MLVQHRHWTITLDTYLVSGGRSNITCTRVRAAYVDHDQFRFNLYRKGILSDLAKWFGAQKVDIGDDQFDRQFVLKGNSINKLQQLFSDPHLSEIVEAMSRFRLFTQRSESLFGTRLPAGLAELQFVTVGVVKDGERLKQLVELMRATLDQLCCLGSAVAVDPEFKF